MVKSPWVYRRLRNFRAGIEAGISCFKRVYGAARCTWRGLDHFKAYIWSAVVAHNAVRPPQTGIAGAALPSGSSRQLSLTGAARNASPLLAAAIKTRKRTEAQHNRSPRALLRR
jgi:hypothetical protein